MAECRLALSVAVMLAVGSARSSHAQCVPWSSATNLSNDTGRYAVDAHMAFDAAGKVHVIYQSFLDASGRNYYTTNASGSWSAPYNVGSTGGKGSAPKIAITSDQQIHVFYGKDDLYYRTKPVSGGSWSGAELLTQGSFIYNVVVDSGNGLHVVYGHLFDAATSPRNGIWSRYKPSGGAWQAADLVYGNTDDGNWPRCSGVGIRGNVVWVGIEVNGDLYIKKRPAGGPWGAGTGTLFSANGRAATFAFSSGSEMAVVYHEDIGGGQSDPWFEIYVRYSYNDGATWTTPEDISDMTDDIDRSPQAAYDALGNLHVVYEGFCCDHQSRVRYRGRIGGYWGNVLRVRETGTSGIMPDAIRSFGNALYLAYSATGSGVVGLYDVFIASSLPTQPIIQLHPASLSRTLWVGDGLSADSFTIVNGCPGTLIYSVTGMPSWMQAVPSSGSSTTDIDTITVSYPGVSQIRAGTYAQTLLIGGNALNSPATLPVTITVQTVKPDLDGDNDVDQDDFAILQMCMSGTNVAQADPACQQARLDGDADVDVDDVAVYVGCVSGPNHPPVRTCAN